METAGEGKAILDSDPKRVKLIGRVVVGRGFSRMNANQTYPLLTAHWLITAAF
jgi:hypothetical protein